MGKILGCLMSVSLLLLSACAHRGATRVECNGALRPINATAPEHDPVTIAPATIKSDPEHEKQP